MADVIDRTGSPRPGWLALGLLLVMALALAWSVQEAGWVPQADFLVPAVLWAVAAGALLGWLGWTIVIALPLGALAGGLMVVWMIGGEYFPALDQAGRAFALRDEAVAWTVTVVRSGYPAEMSPYAIGLGALGWSTAFTAAFTVFRRHRVLDAILLLGVALLVNMSATFTDLFGYLLLFVSAAMLLWLRAALATREGSWQRRRVNEEGEVPAAIMRSGIVFAAGSILLAWILTGVAIAAPLTGAWRSLDGVWDGVRDQFEGVFGSLENPQSRITGSSFGSSFTVFGEWSSDDAEAMVVYADRALYTRTVTYDRYTGRGWERTDAIRREVPAGESLFDGATPERPVVAAAVSVERVAIEMRQSIGRNLFTAGSPLRIVAPSVVLESAGRPVLGGLEAVSPVRPGEAYEILTAISQATEVQLRSAGTDYPDVVRDLYLDASGATDRVAARAREVTAGAESPYDQVRALARWLRGSEFTYDPAGLEVRAGADLVDTFLFAEDGRRGYCQHYASAMALMARSLGIPARVAVGFAPGERIAPGQYLQREANAHAWAEVYFPGYGWEIFEATKSIDPQFVRARGVETDNPGPVGPGIDPLLLIDDWRNFGENPLEALPSPDLVDGAIDPETREPVVPGGGADQARMNNALIVALLVLAAFGAFWLRVRHVESRWRLLPAGDRAWRRLTAAAERAGIGPRPSETIYEYSGWLEEQLPAHGEPIRTVADGRVWESYSGRRLALPAAARLESAWARLRMPLLGLAIRRGFARLLRRDVD
ncbi:MAG TPA: transglutaminaseTgpA domain-containing protein [Candidatus Angelobacter sp.]|nr:transglutaminaseTgpA domain-containing protein [Candidatus Angelobacter sp.]